MKGLAPLKKKDFLAPLLVSKSTSKTKKRATQLYYILQEPPVTRDFKDIALNGKTI